MAIKYLSSIDLGQLEIQNARVQNLASAPSTPVAGQIYYNTQTNTIYFHNGTEWLDISGDIRSVSAGDAIVITSPVDARDLIVSVNSTIAGNGLIWTAGVIDVGAGDGIEVTGSNVRFKNATSLSNNRIMLWDDNNAQLDNAKIIQSSQVTQDGTVYTVTIDAEETVVNGNLTVNGALTSITSNEVNIGDSIILLNSDIDGSTAPTQNGGFAVKRGSSAEVSFIWDETNDYFSTVNQKLHVGNAPSYTLPASIGTQYTETGVFVHDASTGEAGILKKMSATNFWKFAGTPIVYSLNAQQGNVTKSGNTYTITHDLQSRAVIVEVIKYDTYETVYVDVTRPSTTTVVISFASTVSDTDYFAVLTAARRSGDTIAPSPEGDEPTYTS